MIIIAEVSELTRKIKLPTDRVLSVNGDYQVDGIAFKLPATYEGDFDFSTAAARVHWTGVDKVEHTNLITEVDGNGYPLWIMPSELTQGGHGVIEFAISFVATDATAAVTKRWISDPVSFRNRRTVTGSNEDEEAEEETTYDRLASAIATVRAAQAEVEDTNAVLSSLTGSAPVPVENRSDMVDNGHLYLYTGDETGLVTGNLYYYVNGTLTNGGKYGSMEVDTTLTESGMAADAKVAGDKIAEIKEDLSELYSDIPTVFASGGITSSGAAQSNNARIRTDAASMQKIKRGDYIEVNNRFEAKVYVYSERTVLSSYFAGSATGYSSGIVKIPDEYIGKYAFILVRDANDNTTDISGYVATANDYIKYYSLRVKEKNQIFEFDLSGNWNNLIAESLTNTSVINNGIAYTINDFEITVNGTATSASNFNIINMPNELPNWCVRGKKYRVSFSVEQNCALVILFYVGGVIQSATLVTKTDSEFTVPDTADGILVRIRVDRGVVIDNQKTHLKICDTYTNRELSDMIMSYNRMLPLTSEIPKNAIEYHHLWDELVESGLCQRSEPTYMSYDTDHKYPLYTYTINVNNVYLTPGSSTNYDKVNTDGTLPPYPKKKILLVSGIHGSEHMAPVMLVEIIKKIWSEYKLSDFFGKYDVTIVPLVNPWGYSHSFVKNGNVVYYGSAWYPTQEYEITENTNENGFYAGIRQNADGYDINRDFSDAQYTSGNLLYGFVTEEAQYVRNVYLSNHYYASLDMHQHFNDDITICGYAAISRAVQAGDKRDGLRERIAKACMNADDSARISTGKTNYEQTSYIWTGTNNQAFNNYCAGFNIDGRGNTLHTDNAVNIPIITECGARCEYYFGESKAFNPVANAYGKTFFFELIKHLFMT